MSYQAVASLGLGLLQGWASRSAQKVQNMLADAEAKASNTVREGLNQENAAKASFGGFMASLNNKRALEATGRAEANARQNLGRLTEALTRGSIEDQIANSEAAGAYAASVAMNGVGGASVDAIAQAQRLKAQRQSYFTKERGKQLTFDQLQQISGMIPQTYAGLDIGTYAAPIDYSVTFSKAKPIQGNFFLDALTWAAGNPAGAQQAAGTIGGWFTPNAAPSRYSLGTGGPTQPGLSLTSGAGIGLKG